MKNANQKILSVCRWVIIFLLFLLNNQKALASVYFSEIAWMGGPNSSADEWIELYNDGSDINLDGYIIESESKKISIKLSGTILSASYYLIERTDDNSVPNILADLVSSFGTGLSNAGDNLYLKNSSGQVVDSLNFSSGWPAGDNITKQTMQFASGSWLTAEGTPKKASVGSQSQAGQQNNQTPKDTEQLAQNTNSNNSQNIQKSGGSVYVSPKNLSRFLITLQDDQFSQIPVNIEIDYRDDYGNKPTYGFYRVNFGDGFEGDFKINEPINHIYEYPGNYKISAKFMESVWSLLPRKQASVNISITEPLIEILINHPPVLIVKNNGSKDIDLGNFSFISSGKIFNPPMGSVVFAGKEIWFSPKVTGFLLDDFNNLRVLSKSNQFVAYASNTPSPIIKSVAKLGNEFVKQKNTNENVNVLPSLNQNTVNNENLTASSVNSDFSKKQKPNNMFVWFLFGALIIAGSFVFIKLRRVEVNEANDFSLLEE